jgi:hypothetical protein
VSWRESLLNALLTRKRTRCSYSDTVHACTQVKGYGEADTAAVEVPALAASLNSGDSFVLVTPATAYLW